MLSILLMKELRTKQDGFLVKEQNWKPGCIISSLVFFLLSPRNLRSILVLYFNWKERFHWKDLHKGQLTESFRWRNITWRKRKPLLIHCSFWSIAASWSFTVDTALSRASSDWILQTSWARQETAWLNDFPKVTWLLNGRAETRMRFLVHLVFQNLLCLL